MLLLAETSLSDILTPLTIDFLAWLAAGPRPYGEVMEAWRTSCPRLTVWEDALDRGLVARSRRAGEAAVIELTGRGRALLAARERPL
ncbi:MAG TPA: hypothetical protein VMU85_22180 [Stellaceae bacterium]|nr:hypothetical protein [Stellaceae bacterium]